MAEFRWRGNGAGTKTAYNDGRNWVDGSGAAYLQARYPGSLTGVNDDVLFDAALATGASSPAGYDGTALVKLRSFRIGENFDGTVGSASAWLQIQVSDCSINATNAGAIYLKGVGSSGLQNLVINIGSVYLDGTVGSLTPTDGTIDIAATATIATALTISATSDSSLSMVINDGATLPATVYCNGGVITNYNTISGTLQLNGGTWSQNKDDIATARINSSSASLIWNDGNITTAYVLAGKLDGSQSVNSRRATDVYLYGAGTFDADDGAGSVLITNQVHYYGGTYIPPANSGIAQTMDVTYAGTSDAKMGVSPQTINNTTVAGDGIYLAENDKLEIYCTCGVLDAGATVAFAVYEDDASDFVGEAAVSGKTASFTDADDNKTKLISVWGYELTSGKPYCRVKVTESGTANAIVAAIYRQLT